MATLGGRLERYFEGIVNDLERLSVQGYSQAELRQIVSGLGTRVELYLKSVVFPTTSPKARFVDLTQELRTQGLPTEAARLDRVRQVYNDAKHDPHVQLSLLEVSELARDGYIAVKALNSQRLGLTGHCCQENYQHVFWVAGWDHYIGGDTEVHVILPVESTHWLGPPTLDQVNIDGLRWSEAKADLAAIGRLRDGASVIPAVQMHRFREDTDFAGAFAFEGQYRELMAVLAQYEKRLDLIPGLNRHDGGHFMLQSFTLAAIDVAAGANTVDPLPDQILRQAVDVYAVPADYREGRRMAEEMSAMLLTLPVDRWPELRGPTWVEPGRFNELTADCAAQHRSKMVLIDREATVRVRWSG